jgi:hypothetical protein
MEGVGANRLRAGRLSRHRRDGEIRREPDDPMLWKGKALMRFAPFPTINSVLSNGFQLRLHSHNVVGIHMENRPPMTERDVAPEHPNLNERCDPANGGTLLTPPARGPAFTEFKTALQLKSTTRSDGRLSSRMTGCCGSGSL